MLLKIIISLIELGFEESNLFLTYVNIEGQKRSQSLTFNAGDGVRWSPLSRYPQSPHICTSFTVGVSAALLVDS